MMTMPKVFLSFIENGFSASGKTRIWTVDSIDGGVYLGKVSWWGAWRRYVFHPSDNTVYDPNCLKAIADFCQTKTDEHKEKKNA